MKKVYFGSKKQFCRLLPDDGYKLTTFDEETQDIVLFEWCSSVVAKEERMAAYHEISLEKVKELEDKKELALARISESDNEEGETTGEAGD